MKVLFLGPNNSPIAQHLRKVGESVHALEKPLPEKVHADFIVSHGYRHIIPPHICKEYDGRAINCHISLLPWNRGADPNLWSWIDDTPKGVTIHYIDEGLDTGDIIAQFKFGFSGQYTLRTTYDVLQIELLNLFAKHWPDIKIGKCPRIKQQGPGSYHTSKDKEKYSHLLINGWDTDVRMVQARA